METNESKKYGNRMFNQHINRITQKGAGFMRQQFRGLFAALFIAVFGFAQNVLALTEAGVQIDATATITYEVNGVELPSKTATNQFVVDRKIDFTVATTEEAAVDVKPGDQNQILNFTVTNTGNATFDFSLSTLHNPTAAFDVTEMFDAANVTVFVESGATVGYQLGEDIATYINDLAPAATKVVYVVSDILPVQVELDGSTIDLVAQAAESDGAPGASITSDDRDDPDAATLQDVLADAIGTGAGDGVRDGKHSAKSAYRVRSAVLSITKSTSVISDPVSTGPNFKAIPGAIIRYSILIQNAAGAGATASNITVSDDLSTEIGAGTIVYQAGSIKVTAPNINGGAQLTVTDLSDADAGDFDVTADNTITVDGIELDASESATVTFDVAIQ